MKIVIIGGGKVGYFLAKTMLKTKNHLILIEKDPARAQQLADELNIDVIYGDGSNISILEEANIHEANIVAAVTGNDEENLVICQIVKASYSNQKTIARINNPKNIAMFKALGVDKTVCSTKVIADLIEYEIASENIKIVQTFERGHMILAELNITQKCEWKDLQVKDLDIPKDLVLVSIIRKEETLFPKGDTFVHVDDHIMVVSSPDVVQQLRKIYAR